MSGKPAPTFWPTEAITSLPAAADLPAFLDSVDFVVPARTDGRRSKHREGHCVIRALRWLAAYRPSLFPATLRRSEAPDFVVDPRGDGQSWALEHTDAGELTYQRWLTQTEREADAILLPSPDDDGWVGDAPEQAFDEATRVAVTRKSALNFWVNAPVQTIRCMLIYDQTNAKIFVSDAYALHSIQRAAAMVPGCGVMLVRGANRVLVAGIDA